MSKIRWGILSTAKIGVEKVIPAMQRGALTEVVAIASRSEAKARQAADKLGITKAHGSYEALLADPEVDAVYNPSAQRPARPLVDQGAGGRQARPLREADRALGRRGA